MDFRMHVMRTTERRLNPCAVFFAAALTFATGFGPDIYAQSSESDPDTYYAYDLGIGVGYKSLSPVTSAPYNYTSLEFSGNARYPLPSFVNVAPTISLGLLRVTVDETKWNHNQFFGLLGAGYTSRFSKEFEFGGDLMIGASVSIFSDLFPDDEDAGTFGTTNFIASATGRIALDPSYNLSINVEPTLRYSGSFSSDFDQFNDLSFGLGISIQYRFGDDPDAAPEIIRAIRFGEPAIDTLFAALQSWYVDNNIGTVEITNIMTYPITDVEVAFFQPTYMDNPTLVAQFSELQPNETQTIDLTASFNGNASCGE